jgi:hypothetical protein
MPIFVTQAANDNNRSAASVRRTGASSQGWRIQRESVPQGPKPKPFSLSGRRSESNDLKPTDKAYPFSEYRS